MLNVGIIGCGSIARQRHAAEYRHNERTNIAAVFDLSRPRAEAMAKDFGGKVYDTAEELIADPSIDAVSVCVANAFHAPITIDALNHGKHVLCEKPMAITLKDCEDMLAAAKKSGKRLLIDHNQRLTPAHRKAKELLASGELGRVISFAATFGHKGPEMWSVDKSSNTWFFKKNAAAFGSMADLGIHKIDLMRYLIGDDVKSVFSRLATLDKKFPDGTPIEVDDNSVEILSFKNGALGTVTTSWTHYGEECNTSSLYCEKGILKLYHDPRYALQVVYADGTKAHYELDRMQTNDDAQQTSSGVIDQFVEAVLDGKKTVLDAEDIVNSMRVVFACLESAESNRIVEL
ncbi:MAG: Gfo/Idh/MocA family oxidoreductase [Clostridiales bacterium]|nr:Gfo/Idh/MocA family oxidoreductase [Clostridiales bacterium]